MLSNRAALEAHIRSHPVEGSPAQMRDTFERLACAPGNVDRRDIGGIPCGVFGNGAPVLWLHGGGYVFGSSCSHAKVAAHLADLSGCQVIIPEYRLAPEHPWPAPLDDALAVYHALGAQVAVVGDSAGGHLALNLALHRDTDVQSLALISPNTDRTGQSVTRACNSKTDLMNDDADDEALARMAFGDMADADPAVSPVLADLGGLPPVYLTAARSEVLFGDAEILHARLKAARVAVDFDIVEDMFHMWPLWPTSTPEAETTLRRIAAHL